MSWGLGWKRPSEIFHLTLTYGTDDPGSLESPQRSSSASSSSSFSSSSSPTSSSSNLMSPRDRDPGCRIDFDWTANDDDDQVALRLQSQLMVAMPMPQDTVVVDLNCDEVGSVSVEMKVVKRREPLKGVVLTKVAGSGQQNDGTGVLTRLLKSNYANPQSNAVEGEPSLACGEHWKTVTALSLSGCCLTTLPLEVTRLPHLEKLYLDNNKLSVLPPELGELKSLKVLRADNNMLVSVPAELRQCIELLELSLEHNRLVRPLLDFRAMSELRVLRLFGNPLEFLPEILPLHKLRHLSLANIRIVADENLRSVSVQIETENGSYFVASRHKLSAFFSLIFRFSSCHHPLLASALSKIVQDDGNRIFVGKDDNAVRQLISMISSDNRHVVEQACSALSSLAEDVSVAMQLMKCDIMQPVETVMRYTSSEEVISVLRVVKSLAFISDNVSQKMLTRDVVRSLKALCAHKNPEVQRLALLSVGNLAFCVENRRILVTSESLRELLLQLTATVEPRVNKAAARALAILGENENLRRSIRGRQVAKQGLRILSMDGGGMKGLATVQMLKEIEKGTGKRIHELFDLICGTSTGGMLAVALGMKLMTLEQCEEIYKNLGKLVFAEPGAKDNESASWREKLDQLYKSSSQSFRVVVHGSKHSADQFEKLLKEMCADEDGDLLIECAVKNIPKVFVVSTLVSTMPAQPFLFRNYQYPAGTPEIPLASSESSGATVLGSPVTSSQDGYKRSAFIGSCKHYVWQAIRASSAAPYYLDDFSDGMNRWQDGAIVANNPTVFSIREAQLLWPDTKIDCLVSIGCGSVPAKVRKGGWRYLDTGQVLVESACSVDRVEEALSTLLPMIPEIQYFRFNPVDERCGMELDETDPAIWLKLEAAVDEYIQCNSVSFKNVCERLLLPYQLDEKFSESLKPQQQSRRTNAFGSVTGPSLGWRRNVLLVEALNSPDSGRAIHHARALETFCSGNSIRLSFVHDMFGNSKPAPATTYQTPFASPMFTGSFPSSPLLYSPDLGHPRIGRIDMVPPLSLDGFPHGKSTTSAPPISPSEPRELSLPVQILHRKLQNSPQVGIVHLALQADTSGLILSWKNDVFVVAEPGELADQFVQSVKLSLLSTLRSRGRHRRGGSQISNIFTVADLVAYRPQFQVGCVVHRYIGRQTQVMEDDQEIGAYMFRRTVPCMHLTPEDTRWMVGAWRDRIIICTGTYGPSQTLIKAMLDSGAKAVVCPSAEPPPEVTTTAGGLVHDSCCNNNNNSMENGKFEIGEEEEEGEEEEGEEEEEEEELEVGSSRSPEMSDDWENSEFEEEGCGDQQQQHHNNNKGGGGGCIFWDDDEAQVSQFVCQLYECIFREGATVQAALHNSLASHKRLRYSCHLPTTR